MSLAKWARLRHPDHARARARLAALAPAANGKGAAVPFPYRDRADYKAHHPNRVINRAIAAAPLAPVRLAELNAIQHSVRPDVVRAYLDHPAINPRGTRSAVHGGLVDRPVVVRHGGALYLHDGHHRCTAALLAGDETIEARFVDLDALSSGDPPPR